MGALSKLHDMWRRAAMRLLPVVGSRSAPLSPDGMWWWDGSGWQPAFVRAERGWVTRVPTPSAVRRERTRLETVALATLGLSALAGLAAFAVWMYDVYGGPNGVGPESVPVAIACFAAVVPLPLLAAAMAVADRLNARVRGAPRLDAWSWRLTGIALASIPSWGLLMCIFATK